MPADRDGETESPRSDSVSATDRMAKAREAQERDPVTGLMRGKEGGKRPKLPPGEESQLEAMRWVEGHAENLTQQHVIIRGWLKKDLKGFYTAKSNLEKAELSKPAPGNPTASSSGAVEPKPDEGTEKALDILQELLDQAKGAA